jgi:hypothetical protein
MLARLEQLFARFEQDLAQFGQDLAWTRNMPKNWSLSENH